MCVEQKQEKHSTMAKNIKAIQHTHKSQDIVVAYNFFYIIFMPVKNVFRMFRISMLISFLVARVWISFVCKQFTGRN